MNDFYNFISPRVLFHRWRGMICGVAVLYFGCAHYPMGLSKSEWQALPPERQAEMRAEQYRIRAAERARREEAARQRAEAMEAARRRREAELAERRANAKYRDIVIVTLQGGAFEFKEGRYPLRPMALELVRGEARRVNLIGQRGNRTYDDDWKVSFSQDGQTVILNDSPFSPPLTLVNRGHWENGESTILTSMGVRKIDRLNLTGMIATVRYKPLPGMPNRVIIERR